MGIIITGHGGAVTITLSGEIDHHGARAIMGELEDAVANLVPRELVLDLSGISFMDSSGIAVLLRTHRHMRQLGGAMRVTAIPDQSRRVLDAAGMGRIITMD